MHRRGRGHNFQDHGEIVVMMVDECLVPEFSVLANSVHELESLKEYSL